MTSPDRGRDRPAPEARRSRRRAAGILTGLAALAFLLPGAAPVGATPADTLRVFFTAETRGNLSPCNCPTSAAGGLARRVGFLRRASERGSAPGGTTLVLDAGGFLPEGSVPLRDRPGIRSRYTRTLLRGFLRAKVQGIALDHGMRRYLRELAPTESARLGASLLEADPPGPPRLVAWGDRRVAVLALEESLPDSAIIRAGVQARSRGDCLIVLARADAFSGRRVARLSRADLVILSRGARPAAPLDEGPSWLVGCGLEGREVGEIALVAASGAEPSDSNPGRRFEVALWRSHAMDASVAPDPPTQAAVDELLREAGTEPLAGVRE